MERERSQRHLEHIEKLTKDNEDLIIKSEELLGKRKQMDGELARIKERFGEEVAREKQ